VGLSNILESPYIPYVFVVPRNYLSAVVVVIAVVVADCFHSGDCHGQADHVNHL
jgi:hypothetical protein